MQGMSEYSPDLGVRGYGIFIQVQVDIIKRIFIRCSILHTVQIW